MFENNQIFRAIGWSIIIGIFCGIAIDLENLLILEFKLAILACWGERETLLIWYLLLNSSLQLNESVVLSGAPLHILCVFSVDLRIHGPSFSSNEVILLAALSICSEEKFEIPILSTQDWIETVMRSC